MTISAFAISEVPISSSRGYTATVTPPIDEGNPMAGNIAVTARTYNSITLNLITRTSGYDQYHVQVGARPNLQFGVAPIYTLVPDGSGSVTISNLNQSNLYYLRVREKRSSDGNLLGWTTIIPVFTPLNTARDTTPQSLMATPAIIVPPEPVTWSSTFTLPGFPATNLSGDAPQEQAYLTGYPATLDFDSPGSPIDTVALLATNLPAGATWYIQTFSSAANRTAGTPVAYSSGSAVQFQASPSLPGRVAYHGLMRLPAPRSEPFWRITLGDGGGGTPPNNLTVMSFGVAGLARTAKNIAADKTETALDYGSVERTRDGIPDRRFGYRGRRVEFDIALMTEAQWETQFSDVRNKVGLTEPVLVVPNMRSGVFLHDRILYGPLAANKAGAPYVQRFTQTLSIDSLI